MYAYVAVLGFPCQKNCRKWRGNFIRNEGAKEGHIKRYVLVSRPTRRQSSLVDKY